MPCQCDRWLERESVGLPGRCWKHAMMMRVIHDDGWWSRDGALVEAVYAESDGYGAPGFIPVQGYDWSGIRDSSPEAIERMYTVVKEWTR